MEKNKLQKIKLLEKQVRLVHFQKHTLFRLREKSEHSLYAKENSSDEYASDRLESGTKTVASQTIHQLDKVGRWGVQESRQNVSKVVEKFRKSQAEKLVRQAQTKPEVQIHFPQTTRQVGQFAKPIRQMGKSNVKATRTSLKTAQRTAKSGIKTAQHTVKTAEQAGKVSVKTAEQAAKTIQQTAQAAAKTIKIAIPAIKTAAKAAVTGAKAAAKAVIAAVKGIAASAKALAAVIAAGGWIAVKSKAKRS